MRKHFWWITCAGLLFSITIISWKPVNTGKLVTKTKVATVSSKALFEQYVDDVYQAASLQASGLDEAVFRKAVTGFMNLKSTNKISPFSSVVTVVDFNKSSREKRMWIIDLVEKHLLINTWVAHGQGSGDDIANSFSNTDDSHQSSLGFYIADDVYFGKHGRSLHLDGLDEGFNTAARSREIVVHAADYVGEGAIAQLGRLGRSWGCPAVAPEIANQVIDAIKGKTVFFINGSDSNYYSKYLNEDLSANYVFPTNNGNAIANL
jgi:hypothetical protein